MRLFGFEITRAKAPAGLQPVRDRAWYRVMSTVREPFTGAWQRNMELRPETILSYSAVYSCVTLIASDVGKVALRLVEQDADGIWSEITASAFSPVLTKPNRYQTRIKFLEQWIVSKLLHGNTYVLKERDARNVVVALYILDPTRVKPLVAPDGSVWYQLCRDNLSGIETDDVVVPASEIIHDTMVPLWHPLCGVSPLTACNLAALQGLSIQNNSQSFFANNSTPGGVITAPGEISDEDLERIKVEWHERYSGVNAGKVAVLNLGMKYEQMSINPIDSQLIEQLKLSAETVCSCFHVPPYMIGIGDPPTYNNIEALNQQYYTQCLQKLFEAIELLLDEGLGLTEVVGKTYGTEFDLEGLLRMDTATKVKTAVEGIKGGLFMPDEGRKKFDLKPVPGGDQVYLQQQNYSLEALAKRDDSDDPFGTAPKPAAEPAPSAGEVAPEDLAAAFAIQFHREWRAT